MVQSSPSTKATPTPFRNVACAVRWSPAPPARAVCIDTLLSSPTPKTSGTISRELAKAAAARGTVPTRPIITVSTTPISICANCPNTSGTASRRVAPHSSPKAGRCFKGLAGHCFISTIPALRTDHPLPQSPAAHNTISLPPAHHGVWVTVNQALDG